MKRPNSAASMRYSGQCLFSLSRMVESRSSLGRGNCPSLTLPSPDIAVRLLVWFFALTGRAWLFSMSNPIDREVAVFGAARRLPAGERAAYLDEACAGNAALRQRVEELLRASEEAGGFLEDAAPGAQRPADASASPNP